jgi:hypothetical protein
MPAGAGDPNPVLVYAPIKEGFYTGTTLATAIETQLNSATGLYLPDGTVFNYGNPDWTVTYNPDQTFTIENTTEYFYISTGDQDIYPDAYIRGQRTINDLIGFNYGGQFITGTTQGVLTQTGGVASLCYTRYVDITSNKLTKFSNAKDSLTQLEYNNIICRIYLDNDVNISGEAPFGVAPCVNLYRQFKNPKWIQWSPNEFISDLDLKLYDDAGQLLYIPTKSQGANYLLTVQLSES